MKEALCSTAHFYRPLFADRSMHLPAMMATEGDAVMIHESSVRYRGHHGLVYKKKVIGLKSTAIAIHDQHAWLTHTY